MSGTLNNKKVVFAWTMYDWANSVFSLTIATAIFPIYFNTICKAAAVEQDIVINGKHYLHIFGINVLSTELYSYVVSLGFLLVALLSPLLSGIADYKQNKKFFLKLFCYLGSASCIGLFFFNKNNIEIGVLLFVLSLVGFSGSLVFYNAFLPEIVSEDKYDSVSAKGFSMGYIGSVLLLLLNLVTIMIPEMFFPIQQKAIELSNLNLGITINEATKQANDYYALLATKLAFVSVGVWWAGFAQITFWGVPEAKKHSDVKTTENTFTKGFNELKNVYHQLKHQPALRKFLLGFFFTSMGVQTVMYVASLFGEEELKLKTENLIITVLIIQFVAIGGATFFAKLSSKIGNIYTLLIMLFVWICICVFAYGVTKEIHFYLLAFTVGLVMGGIQSMMRSTFAKIIPEHTPNTASYFSFYDVSEKLASVFGTFSFGLINGLTGSMRMSIVALTIYFILGLFFVSRIKNFKIVYP
ncbi:MAG: MFS transporter [Bacteroidia bacterium]|nr:MFS transporter [Bacteroidia bacterium]MCZ2141060.1 MFS transporter [Bacteroidia bacterium]